MAIQIAHKTLDAISKAIEYDQGNLFRKNLGLVIPHIGDAYRENDIPFRGHMGASLIGSKCAREILYGFRWCVKPHFDGRIIRLFNRGHIEEARFIAMLLTIGVDVYQQDEHGKQYSISDCNGYFGGSSDGILLNVPDLFPGQKCIAEFKTSSSKYFLKLKNEGVQISKPEHYVQMNVYMYKMGIPVALYMVVNKDNDELYAEIVTLDGQVAVRYIQRAQNLIFTTAIPKRISDNKSWFECKYCDFRRICHDKQLPYETCRTCKHVIMPGNGAWKCKLHNIELDQKQQFTACQNYQLTELLL